MTPQTRELQGDLRAGDAEALRAELLAMLDAGDLRVGTAGLTSADMAAVQVLLSAQHSAAQRGRSVKIDIPHGGVMAVLLARLALEEAMAA